MWKIFITYGFLFYWPGFRIYDNGSPLRFNNLGNMHPSSSHSMDTLPILYHHHIQKNYFWNRTRKSKKKNSLRNKISFRCLPEPVLIVSICRNDSNRVLNTCNGNTCGQYEPFELCKADKTSIEMCVAVQFLIKSKRDLFGTNREFNRGGGWHGHKSEPTSKRG